ncbi:MAG: hypothetical protein M5U01_28920 [Ardenticatenaceae bacterium]|nr:hypothetical protein [Ardenticatenaceae bacterium]HBY96935.1 hypothetical protein [Chloroflexota bacterium]
MGVLQVEDEVLAGRKREEMHADEGVKDPVGGAGLGGVALLIRKGLLLGANPKLECGVNEQIEGYGYRQGHKALRRLQKKSRGQKGRGFEKAKAPFGVGLAFIARERSLRREGGAIELVGSQDKATVLIERAARGALRLPSACD